MTLIDLVRLAAAERLGRYEGSAVLMTEVGPVLGGGLDDGLDDWLEVLYERLPPDLPSWQPSLVDDLQAALNSADDRVGAELDAAAAAIVAAAAAATVPRRFGNRHDWRMGFLALLAHDVAHELEQPGAGNIPSAREQLSVDLQFLRDSIPSRPGSDLSARRELSVSSPSLLRFATVIVLADILAVGDSPRSGSPSDTLAVADQAWGLKAQRALEIDDVPAPDAPWLRIAGFAHTFNGYAHFGEDYGLRCSAIRDGYFETGEVAGDVDDLRACLSCEFHMDRFIYGHDVKLGEPDAEGIRHFVDNPNFETSPTQQYRRAILSRIRDLLS